MDFSKGISDGLQFNETQPMNDTGNHWIGCQQSAQINTGTNI